jgi:hypothetical protein
MDRRILVSPDEEITLRRVALGIAKPQDLRAADLRHLFELNLVEHLGGLVILTERGRRRYQSLPKAADKPGAEGLPDLATVLRRQWSGTGS